MQSGNISEALLSTNHSGSWPHCNLAISEYILYIYIYIYPVAPGPIQAASFTSLVQLTLHKLARNKFRSRSHHLYNWHFINWPGISSKAVHKKRKITKTSGIQFAKLPQRNGVDMSFRNFSVSKLSLVDIDIKIRYKYFYFIFMSNFLRCIVLYN